MEEIIKELERLRDEVGLMVKKVYMMDGLSRDSEAYKRLIEADVSLFLAIKDLKGRNKNGRNG